MKMEILKYEDLFIGQNVTDGEEEEIGEVIEIDDIHNIQVRFGNHGQLGIGLFCLDENCDHYDPLYRILSDTLKK